jgi:hypothetical protein
VFLRIKPSPSPLVYPTLLSQTLKKRNENQTY